MSLIISSIITIYTSVLITLISNHFTDSKQTKTKLLKDVISPMKFILDNSTEFNESTKEEINNLIKNNYYLLPSKMRNLINQMNTTDNFCYDDLKHNIDKLFNFLLIQTGVLSENKYDKWINYLSSYFEKCSKIIVVISYVFLIGSYLFIELFESFSWFTPYILPIGIFLMLSNALVLVILEMLKWLRNHQ